MAEKFAHASVVPKAIASTNYGLAAALALRRRQGGRGILCNKMQELIWLKVHIQYKM